MAATHPIARAPLYVLGFDSFEPSLLRRFVSEGDLPTLAGLQARGSTLPFLHLPGFFVGATWPTLATGTSTAIHGWHCYRQRVPGTYRDELVPPEAFSTPTFWGAASRAGRNVAVLDVPRMALERDHHALQLVEWIQHDDFRRGFSSVPPEFAAEVEARFGADTRTRCDDLGGTPAGWRQVHADALAQVDQVERLHLEVVGRQPWDLFFGVHSAFHCATHQLWHLHDPEDPRHDQALARELGGDPLRTLARRIDAAVATFASRLPEGARLGILLSHGAGPHLDQQTCFEELMAWWDPAPSSLRARAYRAARSAWNALPLWLRAWSPVSTRGRADMRAAGLARDRAARAFYPVENDSVWGALRLNVEGRDPQGKIPAGEAPAYLRRLRGRLRAITGEPGGQPLFPEVLLTAEAFEGPRVPDLPDLLAFIDDRYPLTAAVCPERGRFPIRRTSARTGNHSSSREGLLVVAGPGLKPGGEGEPGDAREVAPTLAGLAGVALPDADFPPRFGFAR